MDTHIKNFFDEYDDILNSKPKRSDFTKYYLYKDGKVYLDGGNYDEFVFQKQLYDIKLGEKIIDDDGYRQAIQEHRKKMSNWRVEYLNYLAKCVDMPIEKVNKIYEKAEIERDGESLGMIEDEFLDLVDFIREINDI